MQVGRGLGPADPQRFCPEQGKDARLGHPAAGEGTAHGHTETGAQLSPAGCHLHPPRGPPLPQAPSVAPTPARVTLGNCVPSLKSIQTSPLQVQSCPRRCPPVPTPRGSGPVPCAPCSLGAPARGTGRRLRSAVEVAPPPARPPRPPPQQGFDVTPSPRGSPRVCLLDPRHTRPW